MSSPPRASCKRNERKTWKKLQKSQRSKKGCCLRSREYVENASGKGIESGENRSTAVYEIASVYEEGKRERTRWRVVKEESYIRMNFVGVGRCSRVGWLPWRQPQSAGETTPGPDPFIHRFRRPNDRHRHDPLSFLVVLWSTTSLSLLLSPPRHSTRLSTYVSDREDVEMIIRVVLYYGSISTPLRWQLARGP